MSSGLSTVDVEVGARRYAITIGSGMLGFAPAYASLGTLGTCVVVSNETVGPIYAERVVAALAPVARDVRVLLLPDGESHKNWVTLERIFDFLLATKCDRGTTLFALGGGVIGDLTGFAAASYMRGVAYVQLPTTLLAQVDSSVGGKTAINHTRGKNMIGAFHQPRSVIADIDALDTLAQRELIAGLAEVIKYGLIADGAFLHRLEHSLPDLLSRNKESLLDAISRSCEIKAAIVAEDEFETGLRATLNFGHTFAHAIEAGTGYGTWLHGEAVGCGMAMAADLSARVGLIDALDAARIRNVIRDAGLPLRAPALGHDRYLELMRIDKKSVAGQMRFVLLDAIGRARVAAVAESDVLATIETFCSVQDAT